VPQRLTDATLAFAKGSMKEVLREMIPCELPLSITLLLITYIPSLTTCLPRLAMG
jgi:TRAP-type C4-dicarboxylate transport system permease large subunit